MTNYPQIFERNRWLEIRSCEEKVSFSTLRQIKILFWANSLIEKFCLKELDLENITFVDEKIFLLLDHIMLDTINEKKQISKTLFCSGITVWGGIGYNGTTSIYMTP